MIKNLGINYLQAVALYSKVGLISVVKIWNNIHYQTKLQHYNNVALHSPLHNPLTVEGRKYGHNEGGRAVTCMLMFTLRGNTKAWSIIQYSVRWCWDYGMK